MMVYSDICEAFARHGFEYGERPNELFINYATLEELKKAKELMQYQFNYTNPVSTVFDCPIYVVHMSDSFHWLSKDELHSLRKKPIEEGCPYKPITRVNRIKDKIQFNIPRAIVEFQYPHI